MSHVFNNKYYCLFLIYTKQLSLSSYMTVRKTLHIKSWKRLFRWDIYWCLDRQTCTLSSVTKVKKGFLMKKERVKGSFIFLWVCYHSSKLNLTMIRQSSVNKVVVRLLSSVTVWILDTIDTILSFFSIQTQNGYTHCTHKEKTYEVSNFWYFLRRVNFILMFLQGELASLLNAGKTFSSNLEGLKVKTFSLTWTMVTILTLAN